MKKKIAVDSFLGKCVDRLIRYVNNKDKIPVNFEYESKVDLMTGNRMVCVMNHGGWFAADGIFASTLAWPEMLDAYLHATGKTISEVKTKKEIMGAVVHPALLENPLVTKMFTEDMKDVMIHRDDYRKMIKSGNYQDAPYFIGIFPEDERGATKSFLQAYKLKKFKTGFITNALATNSDILIVTIKGNEELLPSLCSVEWDNRKKPGKLIFPIPLPPLLNPVTIASLMQEGGVRYKTTMQEIVPIEAVREMIDNGMTLEDVAEWFRQKMQKELDKETFHTPLKVTSKFLDKFRKKTSELMELNINFKF